MSLLKICYTGQYHFRALLTTGEFKHEKLRNIQSFYGKALVDTYNYEKKIHCTGLFIDNKLSSYSKFFKTMKYDMSYDYVYLNQNLDDIYECFQRPKTEHSDVALQGMENLYAYDFLYLKNIYDGMTNTDFSGSVRSKYVNTWHMFTLKYGQLLNVLQRNNFNPESIIDIDWSESLSRIDSGLGFHG